MVRELAAASVVLFMAVFGTACSSRPTPGSITPPRTTPADLPAPPGAPAFEPVLPGANPAWWTYESRVGQGPEEGTVELCALGQAADRNVAYELAVRNVRNAARVVLGEEPARIFPLRAAASHALSGEYRVMVQARAETRAAGSLRARSLLAVPPTTTTAAAPARAITPSLPEAAPPPASSRFDQSEPVLVAPTWYTEASSRDSGRLTIGASAEGASLRDARRQAVAAARAKLGTILQSEPTDFQTPRLASQRLADGRFRVYLLASARTGPAGDPSK